MTKGVGSRAMILAAGRGERMRPLTLDKPKPLIEVNAKPLIDYGLDHLRRAQVAKAVVNVHYLADQIAAWAARQAAPDIILSDERDVLLDTGGGIAKALPHLGSSPFFVLNSDSFWIDGREAALDRLKKGWREAAMDCLLLLCPLDRAVGYDGQGDFVIDPLGRLERRARRPGPALAFIGAYLAHPRLFRDAPSGTFSMNVLWDKAIVRARLHGLVHDGLWLHVGTPQSIPLAEAALAGR